MPASQLTVLFNTYPVAFDCPGGGEVQLLSCKAALERRGVRVLLFDQWAPQFDQADLAHFFSVQGGSIPFCAHVKRRGLPLALSPILWLGEKTYDYALGEIRELLHLCDLALPNSQAEGERLARFSGLPAERFAPIVNGVDERFLAPADPAPFREAFGVTGDFVLCVANIEPRKNQLGLLRAVAGLGLPVLLAGRVRDEAYWAACRAELPDNVRHLGPLEYAGELHRSAYAACSALALATRLETPGLAALEAAAQGAPLCLTREGCTEEYFGPLAEYVDPDDPADIRRGLLAALARKRGDALPRLVRQRYTWDHAAAQLEAAYRRILGREG